jgi:hypothetical protein
MAERLFDRMLPSLPQRAIIRLEADDPKGKQTQQHLVRTLQQLGATAVNEWADEAQLLTRLRELVVKTPVLLFIDNVWNAAQLDRLLPTSFHSGSWLIFTSRLTDVWGNASCQVSVCCGIQPHGFPADSHPLAIHPPT